MASVKLAMLANSDQLNYSDIGTHEMVIMITGVRVTNSDQPVSIYYEGCGERPYKPSKGMIRLISEAWGDETDLWIGKAILIYGDPTVRWGGQEVGGIRIKAFTNISKSGFSAFVTITRGKKRKVKVDCFQYQPNEIDQKWLEAFNNDSNVLEQIEDVAYRSKIENLIKSRSEV